MKVLKFTENVTPYVKGDIAHFENSKADTYLKSKKAVLYKKDKKEMEAPETDKMIGNDDKNVTKK